MRRRKWQQLAQADALTQFVTEMLEAGILERTETETALHLGELLCELTGKPAQIAFEARGSEAALPDSCQPYTPEGWGKNDEGVWQRVDK